MFNRVVMIVLGMGLSSAAIADELGDPYGMLTNDLNAQASYYTLNDLDQLTFNPASALAECAHAQVGAVYNAAVSVTDRCSNSLAGVDIVEFHWSNLNLHAGMFGFTASGTAQSTFTATSAAEISLFSTENLSSLNSGASWSIELHDENSNFLGNLNTIGESFIIEKDTEYTVTFSVGGSNTLTAGGSTVEWQMAMSYASGGGKAVPGAGGLAILGGLGMRRRRRRR